MFTIIIIIFTSIGTNTYTTSDRLRYNITTNKKKRKRKCTRHRK